MGEETTTLGSSISPPKLLPRWLTMPPCSPMALWGWRRRTWRRDVHHQGPGTRHLGSIRRHTADIDIHVIVEYGTRINSVADSVANSVRYNVEKVLGMPVNNVNVHIHALHVSNG